MRLTPTPGVSRASLSGRLVPRLLPLSRRPGLNRPRNGLKPMAMFSRYDPFGLWPPYRTNSSGSTTGGNGGWGGSSGSSRISGEQRLSAATPAQRQAMLSAAISGVADWQQLWSVVERYGRYLTANNVTHALTKLEQVVQDQRYMPAEAAQIQDLLEWLLQRGRELNVTSQLGPQGLGATAGAVSRLQQAQRQQQQQQRQLAAQQQAVLRQQQEAEAAAEAAARQLRQQQAAEVERDQLMRELVDAAVSQKHRLSPQALNNLLSALADIEESNMSAEQIRQLLNIPNKSSKQRASSAAAAVPNPLMQTQARQQQQQQQQVGRQQQQQQQHQQARPGSSSSSSSRSMSPDTLQAAARQLGQLSPELAQEWYDRAVRQGLEQGYIPRGIDQSYMSGFLAREIEAAATQAKQAATTTSSSSSSSTVSGAVLLPSVVLKYSQLMGVDHLALAVHKLAELQQDRAAGPEQDVKAAAGSFFSQLQPLIQTADGATLASIVHSCKDLQLYSKTLLQACLSRAKLLLEQQLRGFVGTDVGFSGRRLGVLLHGLAVLGLRPTDDWLRLAVTAAGKLLPSCSITDLERLASSLLIMRINPGQQWTAAAEDRLEQLAAALGSSDSRRLRNATAAAAGDGSALDEDEEGTRNARRAIVACVKALALLGGQRSGGWYQSILAAEEDEQHEQQQAAVAPAQQQQQQQQGAAAGSEQSVERQLKQAVQQQQQQQQRKGSKMHLHPRHHLQHRQPAAKQQQQQQQQAPVNEYKKEVQPLSSLDDYMDQELLQQQQQQQQSVQQQERSSKFPQPHSSLSVPDSSDTPAGVKAAAGSTAAADDGGADGVEAAVPAAWADEQTSRWAQTRGEAAQPSPADELQQRLDDSGKLFGGSSDRKQRKQKGAAASGKQRQQPQEPRPLGSSRRSAGAQGQMPVGDAQVQEIPVKFEGDDSTSTSGSSSSSSSDKPSREVQRSAAEAADALAALMAEIEGQAVAEADHEEVLKELGLTDEDASLAESRAQAAELQEAADLIEQATKQLDDLQKQQAAADAGAGPGQSGSSKQDRRHHKQQRSSTSRTTGSSRGSTNNSTKKMAQRALGSSGDAAFVAAAKALQGSNKPSRTLLLGCLEAIEQQQQQLRTQLAKQQVESAVAGAAKQQQAAAQDPAARKLQQLKADFERARERAAQEKSAVRSTAAAAVVEKLLPLLDSFEAAEATLDKQQQLMTDGGCEREFEEARRVYNALHAQLLSIIKSEGTRVVGDNGDLVGKAFDPQEMEAVMRQPAPAGVADGEVLSVLRKGYAVGDRLVRPALVVVAYED